MDAQITEELAELRSYRELHRVVAKECFEVGKDLYLVDFLVAASLNRSLQLTLSFCDLIEGRRFLAAAPLVRLQLDNCLRFSAIYLVPDPQQLVHEIFAGKELRALKDHTGQKMTDSYLVRVLEQAYPWVTTVYKETSGFVHLSDKHIFNTVKLNDDPPDKPGTFQLSISEVDRYVPGSAYLEALQGFRAITDLLFEIIGVWSETKSRMARGW